MASAQNPKVILESIFVLSSKQNHPKVTRKILLSKLMTPMSIFLSFEVPTKSGVTAPVIDPARS